MQIACRECQFFIKTPAAGAKAGQCRFAPPTPMVLGMRQVPGLTGIPGAGGGVEPLIGSQFPPVAEDTWCGCFRSASRDSIPMSEFDLPPQAFSKLDYGALVMDAIKRFPSATKADLLATILKEQHGKANPLDVRWHLDEIICDDN